MTKRISNPPPPVKDKPPYVGNTPAHLGQIEAADTMMVGGKIVTREDYRALAAQVEALKAVSKKVIFKAGIVSNICYNIGQRHDDAEQILQAVREYDAEARKFHDAASLDAQHHLREVRAEAGRAGYLQGRIDETETEIGGSPISDEYLSYITGEANQYAEQIRQERM